MFGIDVHPSMILQRHTVLIGAKKISTVIIPGITLPTFYHCKNIIHVTEKKMVKKP